MQNFLEITENFFKPSKNFLEATEFFGNSLENFLIAILIFFGILFLRFILKIVLEKKIKNFIEKSETKFDDIFFLFSKKFIHFGFLILAFYFSKFFITLPEGVNILTNKILIIVFTGFIIYLLQKLFSDLINYYFSRKEKEGKYFASIVGNISNILIYGIGVSVILSQLGYNVSTLVAGLGIGGLAVALAVQPILASIFASFTMFLDKPFKIGDIVKIGNDTTGVISEIGLRNVRIKTFSGTEVVLGNMDVLNGKIENISSRKKVREDFGLGIIYEISTEKLKEGMKLLRDILEKKEGVDKDVRIFFSDFGDFSLNLKITYFIDGKFTFDERLALKSEINLEIKEQFEKAKIDFAYPTAVQINK